MLLVIVLAFFPIPPMVEAAQGESVQPAPLISPPNLPTLVSPINAATNVPTSATLTVTVSDPGNDDQTVSFYGRPKDSVGEDFTLVVIPDPQIYAARFPSIYYSQMQWVVDNKTSSNIAYVISLGDNVNDPNNPTEWGVATTAYDMLTAGGVPYGIELGNHDALSDSIYFNNYFNSRKTLQTTTYGGRYGTSDYDNYYTLFQGGGMDFIVIFIKFDASMTSPTNLVLDWANDLLSTYSDRRAIVITHNLLVFCTRTETKNNCDPGSLSDQGQAIYDALKGKPNLFLMMGGHHDTASRRTDVGDNGNTVYSLRSDYQMSLATWDGVQRDGDTGYLRVLRFSPKVDKIYINTYSPTLSRDYDGKSYDLSPIGENIFSLPYTMDGGGSYQLIGTVENIPSGSNASVTWSGLTNNTEYEWYTVSSDGTQDAISPTWTFTTEAANSPYTLSVTKAGTGSGTVTSNPAGINCGSNCSETYNYNTSVTLNATAATGSTFTGWSGAGCSGTGTCTVIMEAAKSVTASFSLKPYRIYLPLVIR
jgi:hypothetical protein